MEKQKSKERNKIIDALVAGGISILLLAVPTVLLSIFSMWYAIGRSYGPSDWLLPDWVRMLGFYMAYSLPLSGLVACVFISRLTSMKWQLGKFHSSLATLALTVLAMALIWLIGMCLMFLAR